MRKFVPRRVAPGLFLLSTGKKRWHYNCEYSENVKGKVYKNKSRDLYNR